MQSVTDAVLSVGTAERSGRWSCTMARFLPSNLASRDEAAHHVFCFAFFSLDIIMSGL